MVAGVTLIRRNELAELLPGLGIDLISKKPDRTHSVSSDVLRGVHEGRLAIAAGTDAATEIGALVDAVYLHLHGGGHYLGHDLHPHEVDVFYVDDPNRPETGEALRTLAASVEDGPAVRLFAIDGAARARRIPEGAVTFEDADEFQFAGWLTLLTRVQSGPPEWVDKLVRRIGLDELRLYPMLSKEDTWSVRLDGLEIGQCTPSRGRFDVGRDGKQGPGPQRRAWQEAARTTEALHCTPDGDPDAVIATVRLFAAIWQSMAVAGEDRDRQNEHALESRILCGKVGLTTQGGMPLHRLRPGAGDLVNWGSQFPTRWGHRPGEGDRRRARGARYLDAILRVDDVPWAIEMKVAGGAGRGRYYR
ncbi:MAG: uncharacterized protein JWO67_7098, partial [Streptosporangiaceae bacterium]|nr:uncharacterized protein [Streptosporangiaceae bacterium]